MNKMQNLLNNINWKSKKTIAAVTVAVAVLFAALTGVTALTVRHLNTEPAQTTLPVAEEVTAAEVDELSTAAENAAEAANTAPASTTTPAKVSGVNNSASSNKSTGSKTTGKTGSSANSGSASHSTGTNSKPATGSNSSNSNSSSAKPSGGSTAKPTTKPVTTTQPAKKEFAMTKQEIIDYASNYIESTYHSIYRPDMTKNNAGYNAPFEFERGDSAEYIKKHLRGSADATYLPNGWYKVYVEQVDEDTMKVYLFYA